VVSPTALHLHGASLPLLLQARVGKPAAAHAAAGAAYGPAALQSARVAARARLHQALAAAQLLLQQLQQRRQAHTAQAPARLSLPVPGAASAAAVR
jgi:hypothetical protein